MLKKLVIGLLALVFVSLGFMATQKSIKYFTIDDTADLAGLRISDGLHLNGAAYAKFAQQVKSAIPN